MVLSKKHRRNVGLGLRPKVSDRDRVWAESFECWNHIKGIGVPYRLEKFCTTGIEPVIPDLSIPRHLAIKAVYLGPRKVSQFLHIIRTEIRVLRKKVAEARLEPLEIWTSRKADFWFQVSSASYGKLHLSVECFDFWDLKQLPLDFTKFNLGRRFPFYLWAFFTSSFFVSGEQLLLTSWYFDSYRGDVGFCYWYCFVPSSSTMFLSLFF